MAADRKAYASRSSHGRPSASIAVTRGSGTGDTNRGNLLLTLWQIGLFEASATWKASGRRDHSVWMVWPSRDSLSATTFSRPRMCQALRVTCCLLHQVKILHSRHTVAQPHASFLVYVGHYCSVVGFHKYYLVSTEVLELFQSYKDCF